VSRSISGFISMSHQKIDDVEVEQLVRCPGFAASDLEQQRALTQAVAPMQPGARAENVDATSSPHTPEEVLGLQEDVRVVIDGTPVLIVQARLPAGDGEERVVRWVSYLERSGRSCGGCPAGDVSEASWREWICNTKSAGRQAALQQRFRSCRPITADPLADAPESRNPSRPFLNNYPAHDSLFSVTHWQTRLCTISARACHQITDPDISWQNPGPASGVWENSLHHIFKREHLVDAQPPG